jgi:hypothetical protein
MCNYLRMTCAGFQCGLVGVLLAGAGLGCSSDSGDSVSIERANPVDIQVPPSGAATPTGGCPRWPVEQLLPLIGPFHYGVNPKPCVILTSDAAGGATLERVVYKEDRVVGLRQLPSGAETSFVYEGSTLVRSVEQGATRTYRYIEGGVTIDAASGGLGIGQTTYELDALGYPLSGEQFDASGVRTMRWVYHYQGCRLSNREDSTLQGGVWQETLWEYFYDSQGRLTTRAGSTGERWEAAYECAENQ